MFMTKPSSRRTLGLAVGVVLLLLVPLPALSQSCALCYTQAASSGSRMIHALRAGILILVIPPMFLSAAITVVTYRKRNEFRKCDPSRDEAPCDVPTCRMENKIHNLTRLDFKRL
jgi:hypothetical protein